MLGDSIAAGLGADLPSHTLGARLAKYVAKATERSVRLRSVAVVGSESSALAGQNESLPPSYRPAVAVVLVGGHDVTHRIPLADTLRQPTAATFALAARRPAVVVGPCPDHGHV